MTTTGYTTTIRGDVGEPPSQTTMVMPRSVSWGAIWAGLFVVLGIEVVLSTLLVGVFAASIRPGATPPGSGYALGVAVWFFVQTLLAFYAGGRIAGFFARRTEPGWAGMHAAAVWGFATTAIMWALTSSSGAAVLATLNVIRFGIGVAAAGAQALGPIGGGGAGAPGLGGVGSALAGASPGAVAIATWIPIFLFVVFAASFFTAVAGARSSSRITTSG